MANVHCDDCGFIFDFTPESICKSVVCVEEQHVNVTYFYCPACGTPVVISANDSKWYELRDDLERAKKRYRTYVKIGKQDLIDNAFMTIVKKNKRLSNYTDTLIEKVRGKFIVDQDGTLIGVK